MEPHGNLVHVIRQLELALRPRFADACAAHAMTAAQCTAVMVLQQSPGITSSELARRSFVRAQTMADTLEPLVDAGLVRRERDPRHGRRMLLSLTERGVAAVTELAPAMAGIEGLLLSDLSPAERVALADYLGRCRRAVDRAGR